MTRVEHCDADMHANGQCVRISLRKRTIFADVMCIVCIITTVVTLRRTRVRTLLLAGAALDVCHFVLRL